MPNYHVTKTFCHRPYRAEKIVNRGILEDKTGHAGLNEFNDFALGRHEIHHNNLGLRELLLDEPGDAQAILAPQTQIKQNNVWFEFPRLLHGVAIA